jgi:predicted transcriptional regulator
MTDYKLGEIEKRFADLIWNNEPINSGELVKLAEKELSWKKSTTYTILRRLCERGIFQNNESIVTSQFSKEEFIARQSEQFIEDKFDGSLPKFLAAFSRRKKLSETEIKEMLNIILEEMHKDGDKE